MIDPLVEAFKAYLLPGSLSFLLLTATVFTILLLTGERAQKFGRWGLVSIVVVYWLLALPGVARALTWTLERDEQPIRSVSEARGSQVVIVLGGGTATYDETGVKLSTLSDASALRALEAARLYHLLNPMWVIASGGPSGPTAEAESLVLKRALVQLGVPADRILEESNSGNTYEQAVFLRRILGAHGVTRFVLVTSGVHMPRAMAVFRHAGLNPIPSPAPDSTDAGSGQIQGLLPSLDALHQSQLAIREILGLAYYGVRGWLRPTVSPAAQGSLGLPSGT